MWIPRVFTVGRIIKSHNSLGLWFANQRPSRVSLGSETNTFKTWRMQLKLLLSIVWLFPHCTTLNKLVLTDQLTLTWRWLNLNKLLPGKILFLRQWEYTSSVKVWSAAATPACNQSYSQSWRWSPSEHLMQTSQTPPCPSQLQSTSRLLKFPHFS